MANTMKLLGKTILGAGGAIFVKFENIPQNYTDLLIYTSTRRDSSGAGGDVVITLNEYTYPNWTTNNFSYRGLGTSTGTNNLAYSGNAFIYLSNGTGNGASANSFAVSEIYIANYADNLNQKTAVIRTAAGDTSTVPNVGVSGGISQIKNPINAISVYSGGTGQVLLEKTSIYIYGIYNSDISSAPSAPVISNAEAAGREAVISFSEISGAATYTATSSPGNITATGSNSPLTVPGLTAGTPYTFTVKANNPIGSGTSASSSSITPTTAAWDSIQSVYLLNDNVNTVSFYGIPSEYKHLQIRAIGRGTRTASGICRVSMTFNSDTAANYAWGYQFGASNGSLGTAHVTSQTYINLRDVLPDDNQTVWLYGGFICDIFDYSSTTKTKTVRAVCGTNSNSLSTGNINHSYGMWNSTSAITTITLIPEANNFKRFSSFDLYGIKG